MHPHFTAHVPKLTKLPPPTGIAKPVISALYIAPRTTSRRAAKRYHRYRTLPSLPNVAVRAQREPTCLRSVIHTFIAIKRGEFNGLAMTGGRHDRQKKTQERGEREGDRRDRRDEKICELVRAKKDREKEKQKERKNERNQER